MALKVLICEFWMVKCGFLLAAGELLESYIVEMQGKKGFFISSNLLRHSLFFMESVLDYSSEQKAKTKLKQ